MEPEHPPVVQRRALRKRTVVPPTVQPVAQYRTPRFPTRSILDAHPEIMRLVPERWRRHAVVMGALASVCALYLLFRQKPTAPGVHVAPIFHHGEGFYAAYFACLAVTPPVFLSEDDARQVIVDEGKKVGLNFTAPGVSVNDEVVPVTNLRSLTVKRRNTSHLQMDATDYSRQVSYLYVSDNKIGNWDGEEVIARPHLSMPMIAGSWDYYRFENAAKDAQQSLAETHIPGTYGVFYNPASTDGEEQLRQQVRDFIAWLKAEGVI